MKIELKIVHENEEKVFIIDLPQLTENVSCPATVQLVYTEALRKCVDTVEYSAGKACELNCRSYPKPNGWSKVIRNVSRAM